MEPAASRAAALVEATRRRASRRARSRALLRAAAAGLFLASAAAALLRLAGVSPGIWLLAALLPALVLAALGIRRARVSQRGAALLLDREADARERFTAVVHAADAEVRELAARQALNVPALSDGGDPVRFPPSREGLAVALGLFLLVLTLVLSGGGAVEGDAASTRSSARSSGAGVGGTSPGTADGASEDGDASSAAEVALARAERSIAGGEEIPEDLWRDLSLLGVDEEVREAARSALARGDGSGALEALRDAVSRARAGTGEGPAAAPAGPGGGTARLQWGEYESALASPHWDPRYDRIVRKYFLEVGR